MIGLLAAAWLAACTPAVPVETPAQPLAVEALDVYPEVRGMPADVQHFMVRWHGCAHWLGEPEWDEARRRQIGEAVAEVCPGIDALGREVRERHAGDSEIVARLADYGPLGH